MLLSLEFGAGTKKAFGTGNLMPFEPSWKWLVPPRGTVEWNASAPTSTEAMKRGRGEWKITRTEVAQNPQSKSSPLSESGKFAGTANTKVRPELITSEAGTRVNCDRNTDSSRLTPGVGGAGESSPTPRINVDSGKVASRRMFPRDAESKLVRTRVVDIIKCKENS